MGLSPGRTTALIMVWGMVVTGFLDGTSAATPRFQSRMAGWCSRSHRGAPNSLRRHSEHTGQGCGDGEPLTSPRDGAAIPPGNLVLLLPIASHRNGLRKDRRSPLSPMGLKAPF